MKTAKLAWVMQRLLDHGLRQFKCATTRELEVLCQLFRDGRTAKHSRERAHQRDANLNRRKKAIRIFGQLDRRAGALVA